MKRSACVRAFPILLLGVLPPIVGPVNLLHAAQNKWTDKDGVIHVELKAPPKTSSPAKPYKKYSDSGAMITPVVFSGSPKTSAPRDLSHLNLTFLQAAELGDVATLRKFLAEKTDLEQQDQYGRTALILAAERGGVESVKLLMGAGANINHISGEQATAVMYAIDKVSCDSATYLIQNGADISVPMPPKSEQTLLTLAANFGCRHTVSALLDRGVDVNQTNKKGWTALMFAAGQGYDDMCSTLLIHGADKNAGPPGKHAIDIARDEGYPQIVQLLSQ